MDTFLKTLDLKSWDVWFPLSFIALFGVLAIAVALGGVGFGIDAHDAEQLRTIYTDIGVQVTGGIFAIVMSLSLVAIQFAAQEYSHRIMEYYIKSVIFWSTVVVYLGVMIAGILLQASSSERHGQIPASLVLVGTILALVMLVPHFLVTALYLKPEFIIRKLVRRVDRSYLQAIPSLRTPRGDRMDIADDRLLPVVEITERAIDRGDIITARGALQQIEEVYAMSVDDLHNASVDEYIVGHLSRIGRKAVVQSDEEQAARQVIQILGGIGASGREDLAIEAIDALGFNALKRESEIVVGQMISSLRLILDTGSPQARQRVLAIYGDLLQRLASQREERLLRDLGVQLSEIGHRAQRQGDASVARRCLDLVEAAGRDAARNAMIPLVRQSAKTLQDIGILVAENDPASAEETVLRLMRIERSLDRNQTDAMAALEVAKGEIERLITSADRPTSEVAEESGDAVELSDLWRESNP